MVNPQTITGNTNMVILQTTKEDADMLNPQAIKCSKECGDVIY